MRRRKREEAEDAERAEGRGRAVQMSESGLSSSYLTYRLGPFLYDKLWFS